MDVSAIKDLSRTITDTLEAVSSACDSDMEAEELKVKVVMPLMSAVVNLQFVVNRLIEIEESR